MIASSAGRNRWRSSRGLATASPNADDPPPHRTIRPKRESQSQEIRPCSCHFLRNRLLRSPRLARHLNGPAILHGRLRSFVRDEPSIEGRPFDLAFETVGHPRRVGNDLDISRPAWGEVEIGDLVDVRAVSLDRDPVLVGGDVPVKGTTQLSPPDISAIREDSWETLARIRLVITVYPKARLASRYRRDA